MGTRAGMKVVECGRGATIRGGNLRGGGLGGGGRGGGGATATRCPRAPREREAEPVRVMRWTEGCCTTRGTLQV